MPHKDGAEASNAFRLDMTALVDFQYEMKRIVPEIDADRILFGTGTMIDNSYLFTNSSANQMTNETASTPECSHLPKTNFPKC